MRAALEWLAAQGVALVITSGGLGPTADDLTIEVVAAFHGRPLRARRGAAGRASPRSSSRCCGASPTSTSDAWREGTRKQALVPGGATVLEPVGTAPGLVVAAGRRGRDPPSSSCPDRRRSCARCGSRRCEAQALRDAVAGAGSFTVRTLRMYGMPESEIAETLRVAEARGIDLAAHGDHDVPAARRDRGRHALRARRRRAAYAAFEELVRERHAGTLFSDDGSTVDDLVARALLDQGATIATAESCTGGLLAARLTERAGSSSYVLGGIVAYANSAKVHVVGVDAGAHRPPRRGVAGGRRGAGLRGAARAWTPTWGSGITGVAGPGGGTEAKPVGLVCLSAASADGRRITRSVQLPGGREDVRDRSTTVAMHLVRRLLHGEGERAPIAA